MGINTQHYLSGLFENLRAGMSRAGQKVEPVAKSPKANQYERKYSPDVVLTLSKEAGECGK